jgi:hypothetical protein
VTGPASAALQSSLPTVRDRSFGSSSARGGGARQVAAISIGLGLVVGAVLFGSSRLRARRDRRGDRHDRFWLALLIVTGALVLVGGLLAAFGLASIRRGTPPVPEQALEEARLTAEAVKNGTH